MTKPSPRRWFQLHLSTVIALVIAAGALLGANIKSEHWKIDMGDEGGIVEGGIVEGGIVEGDSYGWPLLCIHKSAVDDLTEPGREFFDFSVAIVILGGIAFTLEKIAAGRKVPRG